MYGVPVIKSFAKVCGICIVVSAELLGMCM